MKPFEPAHYPEAVFRGKTQEQAAHLHACSLFMNDKYTVAITDHESVYGLLKHMSIKRNDLDTIHDWRELQQIKNMLFSPEHEAIELYPAESRLVDTANQYHLWVLADRDMRFDFGLDERLVLTNAMNNPNINQRPFEEEVNN